MLLLAPYGRSAAIMIKKRHIVVMAVQNSQVNKKIGELNFGTKNTLQRTHAMLKILNVVINVSFSTGTYKPVHSSSLP